VLEGLEELAAGAQVVEPRVLEWDHGGAQAGPSQASQAVRSAGLAAEGGADLGVQVHVAGVAVRGREAAPLLVPPAPAKQEA